jgi:hypothetical protein
MSTFAEMGTVGKQYINKVYRSLGYFDVVTEATEASMGLAVHEIEEIPQYQQSGEWVITDARHDSTANAYHTTVPCLSGRFVFVIVLRFIHIALQYSQGSRHHHFLTC